MSNQKKQTIYTAVIVIALVVTAAGLRHLGRSEYTSDRSGCILGILRGVIYVSLFLAWGVSLHRRIMQIQARSYLVFISALMMVWVTEKTLKYNIFVDTNISRYLWYSYYISIILIPLLSLYVALSLGKSDKYRLPKWASISFVVSVLFVMLVMTNDFHQLVFAFPNGLSQISDGEYTHALGYFVIMAWVLLCTIIAFVFIVVKCRVPHSKRRIYVPCIPLVVLIVYAVMYFASIDIVHSIAGDVTTTICLLTATIFEFCIQSGLIQSNMHYRELFECSGIRAIITDNDYNVLLSSLNTEKQSKDLMCQTETAPVMLQSGLRLCGAPIKSGHVIWSEDVSEIAEVIAELSDSGEYLTTRKMVLHKEVETRKREQRLIEQNRMYNRLVNDNQEEYVLYQELLSQLESTKDIEQEQRLTARLAIVCTHIKRRGNLFFYAEKGEIINASELRYAMEEWLSNLRLCGVKCNLYSSMNSTLTFLQIVALYDTFQSVILYTLDTLNSLLVTICEKNDEPCLLLNLSCVTDLSDVSFPGVTISDEENGEWIISIGLFKGGETG